MTLEDLQKYELDRVKNLARSVNKNATDFGELVSVLRTAESFNIDTVKHIKSALNCYSADSKEDNKLKCINYLLIQLRESHWIEDDKERAEYVNKIEQKCKDDFDV